MTPTILVPLDGTPEAAVALRPGRTLARALGARVLLLRAVPPGRAHDDHAVAAAEALVRVAQELSADGLAVDTIIRREVPAKAIHEAAEQSAVIAMATHGRSGLGRALLGSVTGSVLQDAR